MDFLKNLFSGDNMWLIIIVGLVLLIGPDKIFAWIRGIFKPPAAAQANLTASGGQAIDCCLRDAVCCCKTDEQLKAWRDVVEAVESHHKS